MRNHARATFTTDATALVIAEQWNKTRWSTRRRFCQAAILNIKSAPSRVIQYGWYISSSWKDSISTALTFHTPLERVQIPSCIFDSEAFYVHIVCSSIVPVFWNMHILLVALITLVAVLSPYSAEASSNTTETPSTTLPEAGSPAISAAGSASVWTIIGVFFVVIVVVTGVYLYYDGRRV